LHCLTELAEYRDFSVCAVLMLV